MPRLLVFENVSLDGYFADSHGDMSWAHKDPNDSEWNDFVASNASGGGRLVFGRTTYEMMASFWPTPFAAQQFPVVAERMNALPKTVFSKTLSAAAWANTTVLNGELTEEMKRMKSDDGPDMCILGSGSIIAPLAAAGLIDEYQFVVNPVAVGGGRSVFQGISRAIPLRLKETRSFANGNVLLIYLRPDA